MSDPCRDCGEPTAFGSGRFVNRIPYYDGEDEGYVCAECMAIDCDRCDKPIPLDEDITPDMCDPFSWVKEDGREETFSDGAERVHYECLTDEEREACDSVGMCNA